MGFYKDFEGYEKLDLIPTKLKSTKHYRGKLSTFARKMYAVKFAMTTSF